MKIYRQIFFFEILIAFLFSFELYLNFKGIIPGVINTYNFLSLYIMLVPLKWLREGFRPNIILILISYGLY